MITANPSRNVPIIGSELSFSIDQPHSSRAEEVGGKKKEKTWKAVFVSGCSAENIKKKTPLESQVPADCAVAQG